MTVHFKDVRSHPPVIATFPPIPQQLPTDKPSSVHSDPGQACDDTAEWTNDEAIPTTDPHSLLPHSLTWIGHLTGLRRRTW
ncbi:hypothetical protein A0H81_11126 [Grifola frondosa]|uniref:Uncharacterized protein n=1 Tax=Grifola frondosa TaxID=5627 RepID=A0A1C7LXF3_GRIFR|nr:hypothetical protein A0H81_11126 [Grifola frondosa]